MRAGDRREVAIEGVWVLGNPIVDEAALTAQAAAEQREKVAQ
jgi:hypothetical protein